MNLPSPVTIERIGGEQVTLDSLMLSFRDVNFRRIVLAHLGPHCRDITLWEGEDYDAIGNWTQEQAEARILELLGPDIETSLQALVVN
jgi:hypothetical protein